MLRKKKKVRAAPSVAGRGWAWEIESHNGGKWAICSWAVPSKPELLRQAKPSPEARPVAVKIVRLHS